MTAQPPSARRAVLELVEVPRPPPGPGMEARACDEPWLRGLRRQYEFVIDGRSLEERLLAVGPTDPEMSWIEESSVMPSVADLTRRAAASADLRRLAGVLARDEEFWPLAPGRLPLYVCPECGDLGCGAITVHVDHDRTGQVTWSGFRHENGYEPADELDLSAAGVFTFDADAYRQVLLEPLGVLDALAADERDAKARHDRDLPQRQARHWRDLLGRRGRR